MQKLGVVNALYPSLTVLAGALVQGKPNFNTIAHVGIMNHGTPQYISLGMNKVHYTNQGIRETGVFSVCLPSANDVVRTDYVGIVSGKTTDKSEVFEIFYGELEKAPLIKDFPVCMECRLDRTVDFPQHEIFIGEIVQTWADEKVLSDGKIDLARVDPLLFDFSSVYYWRLGEKLAPCWNVGKQLKRDS